MTRTRAIRLILYILAVPPLAILPVYAGMAAGWAAASGSDWGLSGLAKATILPLSVAVGGTVTALPLIGVAYAATRNWPVTLAPVGTTVVLLLGMSISMVFPPLHWIVSGQSQLTLLVAFALIFLALATVTYIWGIWRLWLAPAPKAAYL